MTHSDWQWKGLICLFCLLAQSFVGVESRRYDKCLTPDGRVGVCVFKQYCRETSIQLLKCEGDDSHCCPIPTTERSAPQPEKPRAVAPPLQPTKDHSHSDSEKFDKPLNEDKLDIIRGERPFNDGSSRKPNIDLPKATHSDRPLKEGSSRPRYVDPPRRLDDDEPRRLPNNDRSIVTHSDRPLREGSSRPKDIDPHRRLDDDESWRQPNNYRPKATHNERPLREGSSRPRDIDPPRRLDDDELRRSPNNGRPKVTHSEIPLREGSSRPRGIDPPRRFDDDELRRPSDKFGSDQARYPDGDRNYDGGISKSSINGDSSRPRNVNKQRETLDRQPSEIYRDESERSGQRDRNREADSPRRETRISSDSLGGGSSRTQETGKPRETYGSSERDTRIPSEAFGAGSSRPREENRPRETLENDRRRSSNAGYPNDRAPARPQDEDMPKKVYFSEDDRERRKPSGSRRQDDQVETESRRIDNHDDNMKVKGHEQSFIETQRESTYEKSRTNTQGYPRQNPSPNRNRQVLPPDRRSEENPRGPATESGRNFPTRDDRGPNRDVSRPKRPEAAERNPPSADRKNEASKSPVSFPQPYEFSVPRPQVPACGVKPYDLFIAGGEESDAHEWPWMTAIFRRHMDFRPKTFLCGGSLINTRYVLTAAHCFVNNYVILPASSFVVRLGSHSLNSGEEYTVSNLVLHHNHSGSDFFNDIALVRLASEVYVTDKIAPICLPFPEMVHEDLVGKMATVAGWGDVAFRNSGSRNLRHVAIPIVSSDECFVAYSRVSGAAFLARGTDHVICAGLMEGGKDACLGDSGGPLMLKSSKDRWVVVGIVSLGYKCAEPGFPGVYTKVTHYTSWLNTNMKRH